MENTTIIKIAFIFIFIVLTYTSEFFYRDVLFDNSVNIAKEIQLKMPFLIKPLKIYSKFGLLDFFWVFLVFFSFPINYCYTFFLNTVFTVHICNIIKLLYGQGRPFLLKGGEDIFTECEAGYGNPSGHSLQSTSNFLALAQMIIDIFNINLKKSIIIYIVVAILILLINFSRIILGVHSINQIIFGDTLGFSIFFIVFHIIQPHKQGINRFFSKFTNKKFHLINIFLFIIISGYISAGAIVLQREEKNKELKEKLISYCDKINDNKMLTTDSVYKSLYIMSYFGMIYGLTLLSSIIKKKYEGNFNSTNYYYKNTNQKCYKSYGIRFLILLICFIPFSVTFFTIKINVVILYILCSALPMFLFGFLLFGPNIIANISLKISNLELYVNSIRPSSDYDINEGLNEDDY
jgi:membrane-associated phospholipid phosphatase